ncbi:MAG: hypothetical protein ABIX01_06145 [Chitinophagaceae bacterium]
MVTQVAPNQVLDDIVEEIQKLDDLEQHQLLVKLRLQNYLKQKHKPIAQYDMSTIKPPTMAQIDKWKHDSRLKK